MSSTRSSRPARRRQPSMRTSDRRGPHPVTGVVGDQPGGKVPTSMRKTSSRERPSRRAAVHSGTGISPWVRRGHLRRRAAGGSLPSRMVPAGGRRAARQRQRPVVMVICLVPTADGLARSGPEMVDAANVGLAVYAKGNKTFDDVIESEDVRFFKHDQLWARAHAAQASVHLFDFLLDFSREPAELRRPLLAGRRVRVAAAPQRNACGRPTPRLRR